ncbi:hypothetical protein ACJ41O_009264 [Fusarium nematophilum]
MAEAAGLALGVVGIFGIIGAFKDTIDLLNLVVDSKHLTRDYEVLHTKVDLEKVLLVQWAEGVNLLNPDNYDKRLDDPANSKAVIRALKCIKHILDDTSELEQRYGLKVERIFSDTPRNRWSNEEDDELPTISERPMNEFINKFWRLKLQTGQQQETPPLRQRARWMIRDKKKFEGFVVELAHFTAKIYDVVPIPKNRLRVYETNEETLAGATTIRQLKILLAALEDRQQELSQSAQRMMSERCQQRILDLLWFRTMDDRRDGIATAHTKTLGWALEPPKAEVPWDDLCQWLRSESGNYWVSGKAGSGKSTLMKYLYSHSRTHELLAQWAGEEPLLLCGFFYYNLGSIEQKSQQGLTRALLHQILSRRPSLISRVLPNMWKELLDTEKKADLPSESETSRAFEVIAEMLSGQGKICFFIDGLDEIAGEYRKAISFIKKLGVYENIKVLMSSRPIPDCVAALHTLPKLQLQDLTRDDIASYVGDTIDSHPYMKKLTRRYPEKCAELLKTLIEKSSGVWLWIILACRSLLDGFAAHDRVSELEARVDELPPELEDLFQQMLGKIDSRYRDQGSRLLRICHAYTGQEESNSGALCALGLALIEDYHLGMAPIQTLEAVVKRDLCEELEGRLRSRCGGLLEFRQGAPSLKSCFCGTHPNHDRLIDATVVFMHRTVFEFLSNEHVWDLECLRIPDDSFSTTTALTLYYLHVALQAPQPSPVCPESATTFRFWMGLRQNAGRGDSKHDTSIFFANLQPLVGLLFKHGVGAEASIEPAWGVQRRRSCPSCPPISLLLAIEAEAVGSFNPPVELHN